MRLCLTLFLIFLPLLQSGAWHKGGISWPKEDVASRGQALADIGAVATMDWGYYNEAKWQEAEQHGVEFLPMQYGCGVDAPSLRAVAAAHPGSQWLVLNEPDNWWQADCTPEQAARAYHETREAVLVADPAARLYCCGTTTTPRHITYHRDWAEAYRALYGEWPKIDGFHLHSYAPNYHVRLDWRGRQRELELFREWQQGQQWAKDKPIIISEWGVFGLQEDVPTIANEYIPAMFQWFEAQDWIELHLWFCTHEPQFPISGIFEGDGLTKIGRAWAQGDLG